MNKTVFYSPGDESSMFCWLERIKGVKRIQGVGDTLEIYLSSRPNKETISELFALFKRYKADLNQFNVPERTKLKLLKPKKNNEKL